MLVIKITSGGVKMTKHHSSPDRRINRTRLIITEALISLISEKGFTKISVKDITDRANINRSTFYSHYQDKYDLLDKIIEEKLLTLAKLLSEEKSQYTSYESNLDVPDPFFGVLFEHLAEHEKFYRIMFTKMEPSIFIFKMLEVIRESCYTRISNMRMEQKLVVPLDILLDYISSSIIGVVSKWLENNVVYTPRYMALQLTRLAILGTYKAMGKTD
jgi:AcrR family transcriptional regulator